MKKYFIYAASALALAGCSSDDFIGNSNGSEQGANDVAINFSGNAGKITRADRATGNTAAEKLGNKFYVLGTKGTLPTGNPTETIVFDNYQVNYKTNTAGTTDDNSSDWSYVGITPTGNKAGTSEITEQTIKYWDYSVPQYDFIAYSVGKNTLVVGEATASANNVKGTAIVTPKEANSYKSYTLTGATIEDLQECYFTDVTPVLKENYKKPVTLTFKNITARVRVAFYETIPGYSVKDLQFYISTDNTKKESKTNKKATLYTTGEDKIQSNGSITVTYPVVGSNNRVSQIDKAGYNKAFVSVTANTDDQKADLELGTINYNDKNYINTTAKEASMAGEAANSYYTPVLPANKGKALTLRMNYTLVSNDGSGEEIHVYGAKAVIPSAYTAWQPNYAYTYIFKISDNTNGSTSTSDTDPEGLFPITFDAVVAAIDNADFEQETITTIATPSVTSYAFDNYAHKVIKAYNVGEEYPAKTTTDIYFSVTDGSDVKTDLNDKGTLYTVNKKVTEAEVIDALQVPATTTDSKITGRNGVELTKVTTVKTDQTTIPTDDGKTITVPANSTAKVTATNVATTYAYVYLKATGSETTITTAVPGDDTTVATANEYYTDYECTNVVAEETTLATNTVYYKKYKNNNNVYGVKVVNTYE